MRTVKYPVATHVYTENGDTKVVYHNTAVLTFSLSHIRLNTGGYYTATTKQRINQYADQFGLGLTVYADKGCWYATYKGHIYPLFNQSLLLDRQTGSAYDPVWGQLEAVK